MLFCSFPGTNLPKATHRDHELLYLLGIYHSIIFARCNIILSCSNFVLDTSSSKLSSFLACDWCFSRNSCCFDPAYYLDGRMVLYLFKWLCTDEINGIMLVAALYELLNSEDENKPVTCTEVTLIQLSIFAGSDDAIISPSCPRSIGFRPHLTWKIYFEIELGYNNCITA